ncbi:UNVERIFIED_CONTAM: hypothetical protein GTU68_049231 [Idotea baltica]|nr:hypothetical protein [Idotea baltica]
MLSSAFLHNESLLFVFAGPAASGKSSICQALVEKDPTLRLSLSTTTRAMRGKEIDGKDYNFVTSEQFEERIGAGKFVEYATFNENLYGTEVAQLNEDVLSDVLLDIDIQGAKQVAKLFPTRCVVIFVVPPSFELLEERLRNRGTESEESINKRLEIARGEFEQLRQPENSDYLLVNDDLQRTILEALEIVHSERRKLVHISQQVLDGFFVKD